MPDRSTQVVPDHRSTDTANDREQAAMLLEAGMDGDLDAWQEGLLLACDVVLTDEERDRLAAVGGPPPLQLERVLRRLGTPVRPRGHLDRLRLLAERYRLALDGDRDVLRWVETVVGHPPHSLGRADLLGPHGFPLSLQHLGADLEPGPLPAGWLERTDASALADVCSIPAEPVPVWRQLADVGERAEDAGHDRDRAVGA